MEDRGSGSLVHSLAVLAGLYLIQSKKNKESVFQYKLNLMRLFFEGKIVSKETKREYLRNLLIFIDHILKLPENENETLIQQLKPLIEKGEFESTSIKIGCKG